MVNDHPAAAAAAKMNQPALHQKKQPQAAAKMNQPALHQKQPQAPPRYVIKVPRDTVLRVPPPENARLHEHYTRPKRRCCLYLLLAILCLVAVALALAAMYLVLVYKPPSRPAYTVVSLDLSQLSGEAPLFVATIRADNSANGKVGVHYGAGGRVAVSYQGVSLAQGAWPAFYQAPGNVTVLVVKAKGISELVTVLRSVPFDLDIRVPVRLQIGGVVKTWAVPVTVRCAIASAKVVSTSCHVHMPFLFWS